MWLPDLADAAWVRDVLSRHAEKLGLIGEVASTQLVDVRLTQPAPPGVVALPRAGRRTSSRCTGARRCSCT